MGEDVQVNAGHAKAYGVANPLPDPPPPEPEPEITLDHVIEHHKAWDEELKRREAEKSDGDD